MNHRAWNLIVLFTSLIGYLEWGGGNKAFLFQSEYDVLSTLFTAPGEIIHPFIILPLLGQILLIVGAIKSKPSRLLTYIGIGCLSVLFLLILFIGIIGPEFKTLISTLPFFGASFMAIRYHRKLRRQQEASS